MKRLLRVQWGLLVARVALCKAQALGRLGYGFLRWAARAGRLARWLEAVGFTLVCRAMRAADDAMLEATDVVAQARNGREV